MLKKNMRKVDEINNNAKIRRFNLTEIFHNILDFVKNIKPP